MGIIPEVFWKLLEITVVQEIYFQMFLGTTDDLQQSPVLEASVISLASVKQMTEEPFSPA